MAGAVAVCKCKIEASLGWCENCDAEVLSSEMIRRDYGGWLLWLNFTFCHEGRVARHGRLHVSLEQYYICNVIQWDSRGCRERTDTKDKANWLRGMKSQVKVSKLFRTTLLFLSPADFLQLQLFLNDHNQYIKINAL